MKSKLTVLLLAVALVGCDSGFRIKGVAPQEGCVVKAIDEDDQSVFESFPVSGAFTESVIVGGLWIPDFTVQAECGGRIVKSVKNVSPGPDNYLQPIDLGTIEP